MQPKDLAAHYLRFLNDDGAVTGSTPLELRQFMGVMPEGYTAAMVQETLRQIAGQPASVPTPEFLLSWLATNVRAPFFADQILAQHKSAVKSLEQLALQAHTAQLRFLKPEVEKVIWAQLNKQ